MITRYSIIFVCIVDSNMLMNSISQYRLYKIYVETLFMTNSISVCDKFYIYLQIKNNALSLSLSFSLFAIAPLSLSHDLSSLLSTSRRTIVQSTPALCSICLVAKCSALSIGLDLSKPVDRRDESFQTDSVCPRVSFALPEGKQNSVAPFRC